MQDSPWPRIILAAAIPLLGACSGSAEKGSSEKAAAAKTPAWLVERGRQEVDLASKSPVEHDFKFTDQREQSGITFQNRVVDDAGKDYKLVQ
jgi:hypothetical protein